MDISNINLGFQQKAYKETISSVLQHKEQASALKNNLQHRAWKMFVITTSLEWVKPQTKAKHLSKWHLIIELKNFPTRKLMNNNKSFPKLNYKNKVQTTLVWRDSSWCNKLTNNRKLFQRVQILKSLWRQPFIKDRTLEPKTDRA